MTTILKPSINTALASLFAKPAEEAAQRTAKLQMLRSYYAACTRCPLGNLGRTQVIFGEGSSTADVMLVGEAPGRDEDKLGHPFIGRSGRLLTKILEELGLARTTLFISNTAKCRPPENRQPTLAESTTCINHILLREIAIVRPRIICTLGAVPTSAFIELDGALSPWRGKFLHTPYFVLMPTYHPAYLLRNNTAIDTVKSDFLRVIEYIKTSAIVPF